MSGALAAQILNATHDGASYGEWVTCPPGGELITANPSTGSDLGRIRLAGNPEYETVVAEAVRAFQRWSNLPAPARGEIVLEIGEELRKEKKALGEIVTRETGKILAEGQGEVQEMIDISVFAAGLSRQLYGLTMPSERPGHRMYEQWHPLGVVGVISAFNFPVAVWSWNALIAMVCGDTVVWKPSLKTPLCAIAVQQICDRVLSKHGWKGIVNLLIGRDHVIGERLIHDSRIPLISATGSTRMGRHVGKVVAGRLGRSLLELGGNNGIIVMNDADADLVVRAALFAAVGTAGQRCTSLRRLFLQRGIARTITSKLTAAYSQVLVGDPLDPQTLMGPLIDKEAVEHMMRSLERIRMQGGEVLAGGSRFNVLGECFVEPTLVRSHSEMEILREEVFAPILHLIEFDTLDEVIRWHNDVPQGLSSAIFTSNMMSAERFLSVRGSDCGIANVNIGTSGAEIGGAFGGEKETGGGRESGSDAWKAYMRRQTVTINWSGELPLAQGIKFDV
jgi:aldehyde dehydrogenase (NAD+)